jgi:hypothetical protein
LIAEGCRPWTDDTLTIAPPPREQQRDRGATRAHRREQVELEHLAPVVVREPEEAEARQPGAGWWASGVVHEDVEPAIGLDRASDDLGGRVRVHQVSGDVDEVAAKSVEITGSRARCGDDARVLLQQCPGHGQTDPL